MTTAQLSLTTAPTGAIMDTGAGTVVLGTPLTVTPNSQADDSYVNINVDTVGQYIGRISNGSDTVSFSFNTAGTPTRLELTPASQTVLVGADATVTVKLRDASGRLTQPETVDTVTLSSSGDDTVTVAELDGNDLALGQAEDVIFTQSAGTSTITATPAGTLPSSGVTDATATLIKSGTVSNVSVKSIRVTSPVGAYTPDPDTELYPDFYVKAGTNRVVVTIDDTTTAAPGNTIGLAYYASAGTINGQAGDGTYYYTTVTTGADKKATFTVNLGGAATLALASFEVWQVDVQENDVPAWDGSQYIGTYVEQATPVIDDTSTTVSPAGPILAALGTTTSVDVTVKDDFGTPYSGFLVQAYRGSVSDANFLSQGTTNSAGVAAVTVTNAAAATSPTTEDYVYLVTPPVGTPFLKDPGTTINYTTDGNVLSMSVAVAGGGTTPITDTTTDIAVLPYQFVPFTGTTTAATSGTYTVSGGAGTPLGDLTQFTPTTVPDNTVTVTVPDGVKVSAVPGPLAWNAGAQTVIVASGSPVYVFATKTGEHTVTFTSGGKTTTTKIKVATSPMASYNIAISPLTQRIDRGGFGAATVSVTDPFGNRVPGADSGTFSNNTLKVTASGAVLLAGYSNTQNVTLDANGEGAVTVIAGYVDGDGTLTVTPSADADVLAWDPSFTPPTGAPVPTTSAAAAVVVGAATEKTLVIVGTRGTVSGKPGILVDGTSTGFTAGDVTVPFVKFPGQTSYTPGTARPVIDVLGDFSWKRKTGKKAYVVFTDEFGTARSNRIIIPAA